MTMQGLHSAVAVCEMTMQGLHGLFTVCEMISKPSPRWARVQAGANDYSLPGVSPRAIIHRAYSPDKSGARLRPVGASLKGAHKGHARRNN